LPTRKAARFKRKKNKTLLQFLIKNILLAGAVFICFIPVFVIAGNNAATVVEKEQEVQLLDAHKDASYKMKMLQQKMFLLANNTYVVGLSREDPQATGEFIYNIYGYKMRLPKEDIFDETLASHMMIVFPENDLLLLNNNIYINKEETYGLYYGYEGVSYDEWLENLYTPYEENKHIRSVVKTSAEGEAFDAVTINYHFPSRHNPRIIISAIMPTQDLIDALMIPQIAEHGNLTIRYSYMGNDISIFKGSAQENVSEINLSGPEGLSITAGITSSLFDANEHMKNTRFMVSVLLVISWVIAFAVSYFLAKRSLMPLNDIYSVIDREKLFSGDYTGDVHEFIRNAITELGVERKRLAKDFSTARFAYEQSVLAMLIRGVEISAGEMRELSSRIPFLKESAVFIGIWEHDGAGEGNESAKQRERDMICDVLSRSMSHPYFLFDDMLYVITSEEREGSLQDIRRKVEVCTNEIANDLGLNISFGMCRAKGMEEICAVRMQIMWELDRQRMSRVTGQDAGKIRNYASKLSELLDLSEDVMASLLLHGSQEQIKSYFSRLHSRIIEMQPPVSSVYVKAIYYRIISIFHSTVLSLAVPDNKTALQPYNDILPLRLNIEYLTKVALNLSQMARKEGGEEEPGYKVLAFLRENYSNPELCLALLSDRFKMSERSLYNAIKETTGKSYQEYVDALRMSEAVRLLKDTLTPVNVIAAQVGYSSDNTFYKAFKRLMGCSPGKYREAQRAEHQYG
jgi:AraC-like DNA-binding protein